VYVFDTDVLSALLRGRLPPAAQRKLRTLEPERRHTTAITLGELYFGAMRSASATRWLEHIERLATELRCLDFDRRAARRYGELRSHLEARGKRLDDPDLRIAAICSAHDYILVSGNERHFARVPGLRYETWLREGRR
jgi:tRNA(fMet)-specific endonuclease VapC